MDTSELSCPCCERRIRHEANLYSHLLTKHHRSELSAALIETLESADQSRGVDAKGQPRPAKPLTPL